MKLTDVIRRPLVTEKTTVMREDGRTVVFEVSRDANKIEIKQAVEKLLGAKVAEVRTANAHGKTKRQGRFQGLRLEKGLCEVAGRRQAAGFPGGRINAYP
jgi:large subunit ribosomal protein L23